MENYFSFPNIDPVAISLGPIDIRWYALAYLAGFFLGWRLCMHLARRTNSENITAQHFDDLLLWIMFGVILGGRIGYVLFYQFEFYISHPSSILQIWQGGMSFHGGFLGVLVASALFARKHDVHFFQITDILACATPIGIFFGRIANFINGELYGRPTDHPIGIVFPNGGPEPRHPSQLYEAILEGLVLFIILFTLSRREKFLNQTGFLSGVFLIGYGGFRFLIEFFRMPDQQLGLFFSIFSMGQLLCAPMVIAGIVIIMWSANRKGEKHVS